MSERADPKRGRWSGWAGCFTDPDFFLFGLLAALVVAALVFAAGRAIQANAPAPWFATYCALVAGTLAAGARDLYRGRFGWASRSILCAWGICFIGLLVGEVAG